MLAAWRIIRTFIRIHCNSGPSRTTAARASVLDHGVADALIAFVTLTRHETSVPSPSGAKREKEPYYCTVRR